MDATTDGSAGTTGPVFRLVYGSHSLIPSAQRALGLGEIFATARRNNRRLGVTGALMVSDDSFVQALEGDEAVVRGLYARIAADARHQHVHLLTEETVAGRSFGRWAMAKAAADGGADIRLMSNAAKGVLVAVPRPDPTVTPEQEQVLASMRDALVLDHA